MSRWKTDSDEQVVTKDKSETKDKVAQPKMYKVLLHNDDYTTMEFVVQVLKVIFRKSETEASHLMLVVHTEGQAVAGIYPFSVAETKAAEVTLAAEKAEYPLLCTVEPEGEG